MTNPTVIAPLRSRDEAAAMVRLHPRTLLRKAREKKIDCVRSGNKVFFTDDAIAAYLDGGETKPAKPSRNPKYSHSK